MKLIILLSLMSLTFCCAPPEKCNSYSGRLTYDTAYTFSSPAINHNRSNYFGIHLYEHQDYAGLLSMDKEKNIILFSLKDETTMTLPFHGYFKNSKLFPSKLVNNTLFVYNFDSINVTRFNIKNNLLEKTGTIYLDKILNWDKYFLDQQYYDPLEQINDALYLPYGSTSKKSSYKDTFSYIRVPYSDTAIDSNDIKKCFPVPQEYSKGKYRNCYTFLKQLTDSLCVLGFAHIDSLWLVNPKNLQVNKRILFNPCSRFLSFKSKKSYDLAYVRRYDATNEENTKILVNNNRILLIKRLRRNEITDTAKYEYYYFDKDLNLLKHNLFEHSIREEHCFVYKDGFLLFDNKLMKAYYYDAQ